MENGWKSPNLHPLKTGWRTRVPGDSITITTSISSQLMSQPACTQYNGKANPPLTRIQFEHRGRGVVGEGRGFSLQRHAMSRKMQRFSNEKLHADVKKKHILTRRCGEKRMSSSAFENLHAATTKSTFASPNLQNTPFSGHF